jgi:membrane protein implicated in regulation of membrane protease activity
MKLRIAALVFMASLSVFWFISGDEWSEKLDGYVFLPYAVYEAWAWWRRRQTKPRKDEPGST